MRRLVIRNQEFSTSNYKYGSPENIINYTFENCKFKQSNLYLFANNVKFIECEFSHGCKIIQRTPSTFEFINVKTTTYTQSLTIVNDRSIISNSEIRKADIYAGELEINSSEVENSLILHKQYLSINDSNIIDTEIRTNLEAKVQRFSNSYVNNEYYDLISNKIKEKKFV